MGAAWFIKCDKWFLIYSVCLFCVQVTYICNVLYIFSTFLFFLFFYFFILWILTEHIGTHVIKCVGHVRCNAITWTVPDTLGTRIWTEVNQEFSSQYLLVWIKKPMLMCPIWTYPKRPPYFRAYKVYFLLSIHIHHGVMYHFNGHQHSI